MAIKQYSLKNDGAKQLSPAFRVREFRCRDGTDTILIDEGLVVLLQCIREHFGKPVTITSGYRTASHNTKVGGSKSTASTCWAGPLTFRCRTPTRWLWPPTPKA